MQQTEPAEPSLIVHGLYRVRLDERKLRQQLQRYYSSQAAKDANSVRSYLRRCIPLVLFDVQLRNLDDRFSMGGFTQTAPEMPRKAWQVAYDEAVLSEDGMRVLSRTHRCADGLKEARIAFYFHFFDRLTPMLWTYGEYSCPPVKEVPERLAALMPYESLD